jgi:hypothetical protein
MLWWLAFAALMAGVTWLYRWAMRRDDEAGESAPMWRRFRL